MDDIVKKLVNKHNELNKKSNKEKYDELLPIQEKAIKYFNENDIKTNFVISAPTTSGKTFIAELLIEYHIQQNARCKIIYIAPMIALINEKFTEFREIIDPKANLVKNTSSFENARPNILFCTPELLFEIIKSKLAKISSPSLIIIDEVHLISSANRGLHLDVVITFLKNIFPDAQFLAMSATISYINELASWFEGVSISDSWRAVDIEYTIKEVTKSGDRRKQILSLLSESIQNDYSVLLFRRTRSDAFHFAKNLYEKGYSFEIPESDQEKIRELQKSMRSRSPLDTLVESWLLKGIGIHYSDIREEHKSLIESLFRERKIKIIVCTTTLGIGLNLPSDVVIISEPRLGQDNLTPTDFFQISGRAGRKGYSEKGYAYIFTRTDQIKYWEKVIAGIIPLDIPTNLSEKKESEVEMEFLRLINTNFFKSWENLKDLQDRFICNNIESTMNSKPQIPSFMPGLQVKPTVVSEIGQKLFDNGMIIEEEQNLSLTNLGTIELKLNLNSTIIMELSEYFSKFTVDIPITNYIIDILNIAELEVTPIPKSSPDTYDAVTKSTFDEMGLLIATFDTLNGSRGYVTTTAVACAMIFRWISGNEESEIYSTFSTIWPTSFNHVRKKITDITKLFSFWIKNEMGKNPEFLTLDIFREQLFRGVPEKLTPLTRLYMIGRKTALFVDSVLAQLSRTELQNKDSIIEKLIENGIKGTYAVKIAAVWEPEISPFDKLMKRFEEEEKIKNIVRRVIDNQEDIDVEFKAELKPDDNRKKELFCKHHVAFANALGGLLIIGISDDPPRETIGIKLKDYKPETLENILDNRIRPKLHYYKHWFIDFDEQKILVCEIDQSSEIHKVDDRLAIRKNGSSSFVKQPEFDSLRQRYLAD